MSTDTVKWKRKNKKGITTSSCGNYRIRPSVVDNTFIVEYPNMPFTPVRRDTIAECKELVDYIHGNAGK